MSCYKHSTKDIDHFNHKPQKTLSALLHREKHRLNIIFEEYTRDRALADDVRLFGDGVLVGEDCGRPEGVGEVLGIDCGDD